MENHREQRGSGKCASTKESDDGELTADSLHGHSFYMAQNYASYNTLAFAFNHNHHHRSTQGIFVKSEKRKMREMFHIYRNNLTNNGSLF